MAWINCRYFLIKFVPDYSEWCKIKNKKPDCREIDGSCPLRQIIKIPPPTPHQMIEDDRHAEIYYDYGSGKTEKRY